METRVARLHYDGYCVITVVATFLFCYATKLAIQIEILYIANNQWIPIIK